MDGLPSECFQFSKSLLCWNNYSISLIAKEAKGDFFVNSADNLLDAYGNPHKKFSTFDCYTQKLLLRSTEILLPLMHDNSKDNKLSVSSYNNLQIAKPEWMHTHTLDTSADSVYIRVGQDVCLLNMVTINGYLQWQLSHEKPLYYVLENVFSGDAFSAALIYEDLREGHMTALVFSPHTRDIGIHFVRLNEKHLNCIRNLKLKMPGSSPENQ